MLFVFQTSISNSFCKFCFAKKNSNPAPSSFPEAGRSIEVCLYQYFDSKPIFLNCGAPFWRYWVFYPVPLNI